MKHHIPDQADKLRQLVQQENRIEKEPSIAIIEEETPVEENTSVQEDHSLQRPLLHPKLQKEPPIDIQPLSQDEEDFIEIRSQALDTIRTTIDEGPGVFEPLQPLNVHQSISTAKDNSAKDHHAKNTQGTNTQTTLWEEKPVSNEEPQKDSVTKILSDLRFPIVGKTQVIAITGGKGGVGKSNITCNMAIAMARMKRRVMILDADLSLANIDVLLGLTPRVNLAHVLRGEKTLEEILITGPEGIQIIPGGSGLEELSHLTDEQMARLFKAFASVNPTPDVLLIDTAAGIHPNVLQFLKAADQTIVVTTPEPPAYTDAYALIKTLIRHEPGKEIGVVINMAKDHREAMEVTKLLFQMCRQFLNIMFNNLGYIPRDPEVLKAVRHQRPLLLIAPNSPAAQEIRNIATTILQIEKRSGKKGLRGFFQRLFTRQTEPEIQKEN